MTNRLNGISLIGKLILKIYREDSMMDTSL